MLFSFKNRLSYEHMIKRRITANQLTAYAIVSAIYT
jgi:hypothetical protein